MTLLLELMGMTGSADKFLSQMFAKIRGDGFYNDPSFHSNLRAFIMIASKLNQFESGKIQEQDLMQVLQAYPGNKQFQELLVQANKIPKVAELADKYFEDVQNPDKKDNIANTVNKFAMMANRYVNKFQSAQPNPGRRITDAPDYSAFNANRISQ